MTDKKATSGADNPIEEAIADDLRETTRGRYGWLSLVVATIFGLFFAYDLWEAIGNLVNLPAFYAAFGFGAENVPSALLWVGIAIPIVTFVLAFLMGRRRNVLVKALIFLVGLSVSACLGIGVLAIEDVQRPVPAVTVTH